MSTVFMNNSQDRKSPITSSTIQKLLDENLHLILCIAEHQNKGNAAECVSYQQVLHRNLVYLATIADYNQQNIQQPLNNNSLGPFVSTSNNTVTNPSSSESLNQTSSANFPTAFSVHAPDSNMNCSTSFNSYNSSGASLIQTSSIVSVGFSVSNSLNNSSSSHSNINVSSAPAVNDLSNENQQHHVTAPRQTISSDNVINSPYHHGNTPNPGDIDKTAVLASGPDGLLPSTTVAYGNNQQSDVQTHPQTAVCAANLAAYEQSIENVVAKIVGSTLNVTNEETTFNNSNIDSIHSSNNMKNFNSQNHANPNYMTHSNGNNSNFHSTDKNRSALYPYSNNPMVLPYNHMVSSLGGSLINAPPYYRYPAGVNTTTNNPEAAPFQTAGPYFPPHQYPSSHMVATHNYQNQNFQHKQQHPADDIGRSQNQLFSGSFQGTNKFSHSTNHPSTYQLGAENYPLNISNDINNNNQQPSANLRSSYTVTGPNYSGGVPTPAYEHSRMNYGPPSSHMSHEIMNNNSSGYHGNQQHVSAVGGYHGNPSYGPQIYPVGHFPYTASNVNSGGPNLAPPLNPMGYHGNAGSNNAFYGQNSANQLTNSSYGQHNPTNPYF